MHNIDEVLLQLAQIKLWYTDYHNFTFYGVNKYSYQTVYIRPLHFTQESWQQVLVLTNTYPLQGLI